MVSIEVRSILENKFLEGLDLIFRKLIDLWISRVHQGCLISEI
jgi:hypothetical protein